MIVLDASAAIDWLLWRDPVAQHVEARVRTASNIHVPHLWMVEVMQVLRRHVARGIVDEDRARAAGEIAVDVPTGRHPHEPLWPRVWQLRDNLTAYDAVYVALAEGLGATLVTTDWRLANAPGTTAAIDVVDGA